MIILSMVFQTQLVKSIGWKFFGYFESFPGLAMGMMVASLQEGGNSPESISFYLHEMGVLYQL